MSCSGFLLRSRKANFATGVLTGIKIALPHGDDQAARRDEVKALFVMAMRVAGDEKPEYWFDKLDF